MSKPRIAVIGVGHLGKEHARILAGMPDVELVGVADINFDQAQAVARRLRCRAFSQHRPLLHLADAAVIAVPTSYHHVIASEFVRSGISVLVEKPLAATLEQAQELVDLARRHHACLQVGHIERFNPALEELLEHEFQPKYIDCQRHGAFTGRSTDVGVVFDLMIHDLDVLLRLVQSPVCSVEALGMSIFGGHEDIAKARLVFANGCVADVSASRASPSSARLMQIWAPEGYIALDFARRQLSFMQPSEDVRRHGLDPRELDPASRALLKDQLFERYLELLDMDCNGGEDQLTRELEDFVASLQAARGPRVTGEDGRDAVALATRILHAISKHSWTGEENGPSGPMGMPQPCGLLFPHPAPRRGLAA